MSAATQTAAWRRGWRVPWDVAFLAAVGAALLGLAAWLALPASLAPVAALRAAACDRFTLPAQLALAALIWRGVAPGLGPEARRAWRRLALAFAVQGASEVVWQALGSPDLSAADVGYLGFYPLALWALLSFPVRDGDRPARVRFWLDSGVVVLSGATLIWFFVLAPSLAASPESLLSGVVNAAYPVGDVLLIFGACAVVLRAPRGWSHEALLWVAAGMAIACAGDLVYGVQVLEDTYHAGSLVDLGWAASYWVVAAGAVVQRLHAARARADVAPADPEADDAGRLVFLPYIAVGVAYTTLVAAVCAYTPRGAMAPRLAGVLVMTAGVIGLVVARQVQAMREIGRLAHERVERETEARLSALVRHGTDGILVLDARGVVRFASPAVRELFGDAADGAVGRHVTALVPGDEAESTAAFVEALSGQHEPARAVWRTSVAGASRHVEVVATNLLDEPAVAGVVLNTRDVTERATLEARLAHQAYHDALTGLANRTRFHEKVSAALARRAAEAGAEGLAVLFLDLDDFKKVNDSLGHAAGDRLLAVIAERLLNATRGCDTVARLGGDEFAILLDHVRAEPDATVVADRVVNAVGAAVMLDGTEVQVGGSVGVVCLDAEAAARTTADDALRDADLAMYRAKQAGKGGHVLFEGSMRRVALDRLALEGGLRRAIGAGELVLQYQPIVSLRGGAVAAAEALVRWQHPERGRIAPADFIPLAEETGLIVPLGRWVLNTACAQAAAWVDAIERGEPGAPGTYRASWSDAPTVADDFYVTVNLSARHLDEPSVVDDVAAALAASGLAPSRLAVEITESAIMRDAERTLAALAALKALGVRVAIDDFGTGYSSLAYLQRFPVDVLKIDKTFVARAGRGGSDAALARAVIALGEALALRTVAEGIESVAQEQQLRALGCELGQGFLFARPLDPHVLGDLLACGRAHAADAARVAVDRAA